MSRDLAEELTNIEISRLQRETLNRHFLVLIDAGLSCEEAAVIVTAAYQIDLIAETEVRHAA